MDRVETDVLRLMLSFSDLDSLLLSWRPLSNQFRLLADEELGFRFEGVFEWFCNDVESMRHCMRTTAAFIGGSVPLTLFSNLTFTPSNMDIFVRTSRRDQILYHLCFIEGYTWQTVGDVIPQSDLPPHASFDDSVVVFGAGLRTVIQLVRPGSRVSVYTFDDPLFPDFSADVVTLSWSSALFNFVSADFAGCAYPALTTQGRALYHMGRFYSGMPGTASDHLLNTYCSRGFEFSQHPSWWFEPMDRACPRRWTCPLTGRTFGDGGSLVIPYRERPGGRFGREWLFGGVTEDVHGA
ncbi:hypothetical protein VTO73DRAFT_6190 [Trametes versicolor]